MNFLNEINLALENTWLFAPFFFIIGAAFASFFNVVALRFPKMLESDDAKQVKEWLEDKKMTVPSEIDNHITDINLSFPASHCYSCKTPLKWYHNIPVLSYLFLRGKCGHCGTSFSSQYCIVETLGGLLSTGVYLTLFGSIPLEAFGFSYFFFMVSFLLIIIDFKTMYLPDNYNYAILWGSLLATAFGFNFMNEVSLKDSVIGLTGTFAFLWIISTVVSKIFQKESMGGGDLKLVAALGALLGIQGGIFTIFFSPIFGILFYMYFKFKKGNSEEFPYGPSLILSSWVYIFYGQEILKIIL